MKLQTKRKVIKGWSNSAMSDIVFLLLIFFMLTSSFVMYPGIKVSLPVANKSDVNQEDLVVTITKKRFLYIGKEKVTIEEFAVRIKEELKDLKKKQVIFRSDRNVDIGFFVKLMDICKENGATALAISTEQKKEVLVK
jgi:biopolymer transport protein ExbD